MKYLITLFIAGLLIANSVYSQGLIAVQNGGEPVFFQQVDSALIYAQNGDTIYIPGGSWNITQPIEKLIYIVGTGHHPDSTAATFATVLNGPIVLWGGASNGLLTGVQLNGEVTTVATEPVNNYSVVSCRISVGLSFKSTDTNFNFMGNILHGSFNSYNGSASNFTFYNNTFTGYFSKDQAMPFVNGVFKNNVFFTSNSFDWSHNPLPFLTGQYLLFENNIFLNNYPGTLDYISNSVFRNNIFVLPEGFPNGTNVGLNNIVGREQSTIFINQQGWQFDYSHNYRLNPNYPGKNAGTDGTDIGLYGGLYPWKDGFIPFNPHFQKVQIAPKTNSDGNLSVQIKVAAQER